MKRLNKLVTGASGFLIGLMFLVCQNLTSGVTSNAKKVKEFDSFDRNRYWPQYIVARLLGSNNQQIAESRVESPCLTRITWLLSAMYTYVSWIIERTLWIYPI